MERPSRFADGAGIVMLTLGFDTCTEMCTVALGSDSGVLASVDVHAPRAHLQKLLPLVRQMLEMCDRTQSEIDAVAVGTGPGSLTGVRIGVTTARTLAQGLGVKCVGVPTLDAIARAFTGTGATVCVMLDARRNEVYPALYDCGGDAPRRTDEFRAVNPEALCDELGELGETVLMAGEGLDSFGDIVATRLGERVRFAPRELWYPRAAHIVGLAGTVLARSSGDWRDVRPIYTRLSDAEEAAKESERRVHE